MQPHGSEAHAQKNELKPHLNEYWCIPPEQNAEFVACMEDVREGPPRPFEASRPMGGLEETSKQLISETRPSLRPRPGRVRRVDPEYRRNGTASVFMLTVPLEGQRHVRVRKHRKREDFAEVIRELCDELYPDAETIVLVMDQLNTHNIASLYQAFEPSAARRLAEKLEIHLTPKHGSWLNMAEIEIGVMNRQCLDRRIDEKRFLTDEVGAWEEDRNTKQTGVDWRFTTDDARIKLKRLYPTIQT